MLSSGKRNISPRAAFTIVELLVATAVLVLLMVMMMSILGQASNVWRRSSQTVEAFQSARLGFDLITRNLSQVTLNTYLDYDNAATPTCYLRKSELRFVTGQVGAGGLPGTPNAGQALFFQAPANYTLNTGSYGGLDALLNTCGYYISFDAGKGVPAHVDTASYTYRYRLMQLLVPAEKKNIYDSTMNTNNTWFTSYVPFGTQPAVVEDDTRSVAENIIALVVRPQDPALSGTAAELTRDYVYDTALNANANPQPVTANQLPPVMQLTMVAIDEPSALRMASGTNTPSVIASTMAGKFQATANYQRDLTDLETSLSSAHIQYRVFSSAVPIRESKWTK